MATGRSLIVKSVWDAKSASPYAHRNVFELQNGKSVVVNDEDCVGCEAALRLARNRPLPLR